LVVAWINVSVKAKHPIELIFLFDQGNLEVLLSYIIPGQVKCMSFVMFIRRGGPNRCKVCRKCLKLNDLIQKAKQKLNIQT